VLEQTGQTQEKDDSHYIPIIFQLQQQSGIISYQNQKYQHLAVEKRSFFFDKICVYFESISVRTELSESGSAS
jgi:hypothetical protein